MGIAYSKKPIVTGQVRTATSALFLSDITSLLLRAGWQRIRTIPNGAVFQCWNPTRSLSAKLQIQDKGTSGFGGFYIVLTPFTANEHAHGQDHNLVWGNTAFEVYQVVIGCCQLFISLPTLPLSPYFADHSSCFAFGIPFSKVSVSDLWWANGDGSLPFFNSDNFRNSPRCFLAFDYSLNGAVFSADSGSGLDPGQGMLTLFYLTPTYNIDSGTNQSVPTTKHSTGAPINLDALVGWQSIVRGQLFDAFQRTRAEPLDAVQTYTDEDSQGNSFKLQFQVWMSSFYSSLLLLQTSVSPGSLNVTY